MKHKLAKEMKKWCAEHLGNPDSDDFKTYCGYFSKNIQEKLKEIQKEHTNKGRFGMSGIGSCTRKGTFKVHPDYERVSFNGDTQVTFHIGHVLEVMGISILQAMGYKIDGMQMELKIEPFALSYPDGIIEDEDGKKFILSMKTTGYKGGSYNSRTKTVIRRGFTSIVADGIRETQNSWWCQAQAEMYASGIKRCLIVVIAKDMIKSLEKDPEIIDNGSMSFYVEEIEYDEEYIEQMKEVWELAWMYAEKKEIGPAFVYIDRDGYKELPRPADVSQGWYGKNRELTGTFNPCYGCEWQPNCAEELVNSV